MASPLPPTPQVAVGLAIYIVTDFEILFCCLGPSMLREVLWLWNVACVDESTLRSNRTCKL